MIGAPSSLTRVPPAKQGVRRFANVTEYLATCQGDPDQQSHAESKAFYGWTDWETALDYARNGWPEGRERVEVLTGSLVAAMSGRIMREEWLPGEEGSYADLGLFIAREPEYWVHMEERSGEGAARKHVGILYNGTVSCSVSAAVIEARGAAIAALVDLLELAGNSVTVEVVFSVDSSKGSHRADYFTLKGPDERGDLSVLMFWLAHPCALRRMAFASWEGFAYSIRREFGFGPGSYGHCIDPTLTKEPDVYIGSGSKGSPEDRGQWDSVPAVKAWLESTLTVLGVNLTER